MKKALLNNIDYLYLLYIITKRIQEISAGPNSILFGRAKNEIIFVIINFPLRVSDDYFPKTMFEVNHVIISYIMRTIANTILLKQAFC